MQVIVRKTEEARIRKVRDLILSAGNTIGSVHFRKRSDGEKRRMCFRLHASKPTYAMKPTGKRFQASKKRDEAHNMMTVLDVNKVRRNKQGKIAGRGDWRTIPLDTVERVCVKGEIYKIKS